MNRAWMSVGLLGLVLGCSSENQYPCGAACDAEPSSLALQICGGKAADGRQGETHGVTWTDEVAFTEDEVVAGCQRLCGFAARCSDEDEAACAAQCPSVAAQAREQTCEQSLMTAMECLARNACTPPAESSDESVLHDPCELAVRAVSCSIFPETDGPTILDSFHAGEGQGSNSVAGVGESNDYHACVRTLGGGELATSLDIQCRRSLTSSWCCECNVDEQPVRAFAEDSEGCPAADLQRAVEICGWRF
jgi:hypothetical protein